MTDNQYNRNNLPPGQDPKDLSGKGFDNTVSGSSSPYADAWNRSGYNQPGQGQQGGYYQQQTASSNSPYGQPNNYNQQGGSNNYSYPNQQPYGQGRPGGYQQPAYGGQPPYGGYSSGGYPSGGATGAMNVPLLIGSILFAVFSALIAIGLVYIMVRANWAFFNAQVGLVLALSVAVLICYIVATILGFKHLKKKTSGVVMIVLGILLFILSIISFIQVFKLSTLHMIIAICMTLSTLIYTIGAFMARSK